MKLLSHLTAIFRSRGYEVMVSSPENSYLLMKRGRSTLAVGYADPGHDTTEGEVEMFLSMAEDGSADSILFISPEKLKNPVRKNLEKEGAAIWDRMALAIALGEQILSEGGSGDEAEEEVSGAKRILNLFRTEQPDPLKELREFEKEKETDFVVKNEGTISSSRDMTEPAQKSRSVEVKKLEFPTSEKEKKKETEVTSVPDDILMGAWAGFDDWKKKEEKTEEEKKPERESKEEETILPDLPIFTIPENTPPEKIPWVGSTLAPVKFKKEEACAKGSIPVDTDLSLEHVPHILVKVNYSLRSEEGDKMEREGHYLYDPLKNDLFDIPEAVAEELRSTLSIWDGAGPADKMKDAKDNEKRYERALKDRLRIESHAEDRLVRETLMSTIYQEVRYLFDPTSFKIDWSKRVVIPYWINRDEKGNISWMVDSYLGRFIQVGKDK